MKKMKSWREASIRDKLLLIGVLTTGSAFLLASIIFLVVETLSTRHSLVNELTGFARTVASNSTSSLVFHDRASATETLEALRSVPHIIYAVIFDKDGNEFARYQRSGAVKLPAMKQAAEDSHGFSLRQAVLFRRIVIDNEFLGPVCIVSDLGGFYARLARYVLTFMLIVCSSLIVSYFFSSWLQEAVTRPIFHLTELMRMISKDRDYSYRAKVMSNDELGYLAAGFNEMLENIHERDVELGIYRKNLEELVKERTSQLKDANDKLQEELEERTRIEKALVESEYRYRTIFETTGNATIIVEDDTTISVVNSAFEKLTGWAREDIEGKISWTTFVVEAERQKMLEYHFLRRVDPNLVPSGYEFHLVDREGFVKAVYIVAATIPGTKRSVASLLDITDRKLLEEQLLQAQKMEAVGRLAGGVAHDFNNILTAIIGYASLLNMKTEENSPLRPYIESVLSSAERATNLTRGLLAFSRKQLIAPKAIDLNGVIRRVQGLLSRVIGEDIDLRTRFTEEQLTVFADAGQLEQVLMNFAANARDAMPAGGLFRIETGVIVMDEKFIQKHRFGKTGKYAVIAVSDTGDGMPPETAERIFEPFFTTKEVGKGTGLGLSIVYGIIRQHEGYVNVYSELGKGTTFRVYLPLLNGALSEEGYDIRPRPRGGKEGILLAEDDNMTRALIREVLQEAGYRVFESINGEDALVKFATNEEEVDLIILDVVMPKKNGKAVYDEIKEKAPGVKALFMSGYTADILTGKGIFEEKIHFLSKPVIPDDLLRKVRELLDRSGVDC